MNQQDADQTRATVRDAYAKVATTSTSCCGATPSLKQHAQRLGYDEATLDDLPEGANLGLGCGNPTAGLTLEPTDVVLDLGSGAGMDAFVVARDLGPQGRVLGVDMTPEMITRARDNAQRVGLGQRVEFRQGTIEQLPVDSDSVDAVISNCVINLSPDKPQVFREAFRVLKPGGRLSVSDIVLTAPLPPAIAELAGLHAACIAGAALADDYLGAIRDAGFVQLEVERQSAKPMFAGLVADPTIAAAINTIPPERVMGVMDTVWSYRIRAIKP